MYFLNVAQASCYEVKSQLYLALDVSYIDKEAFERTYSLCDEISKTLYGLIKHLKNKTWIRGQSSDIRSQTTDNWSPKSDR